ncbi:MAG: hypothetical protein Q8K75_07985 [Chlamydiales bacterium]|nr:hypothetical protein [Chlamydiales bacterium]
MQFVHHGVTGSSDLALWHELKLMYCAFRRHLPQTVRRQARLEYKIRYIFSATIGVLQTTYRYGCILAAASICWSCQVLRYQTGVKWWRYWTFCNTVALARSSMNITAYQAGCYSARWGLFLNAVSRVGSRALLGFYDLCFRYTDFFSDMSMKFPLEFKSLGMAMWTRALCIHRYVTLALALGIHQLYKRTGQTDQSYCWNGPCRNNCVKLLKYKMDIPFYEVAAVSPDLASKVLFKLTSIIQLLVEHRLLRGPFPSHPAH